MNEEKGPATNWDPPWKSAAGLFWLMSYVVVILIGVFIPDDVQNRWPAANALSEFMSSWNSQVREVGEMNVRGAKSLQFFYAFLWCVMPLYWLLLARMMLQKLKRESFVSTVDSKAKLIAMLAVGSLVFFLLLHPAGDTSSRVGYFLFGSVLTRSFFAPGLVFLVGFFALPIFCVLVSLLTGRVRYKNEKR